MTELTNAAQQKGCSVPVTQLITFDVRNKIRNCEVAHVEELMPNRGSAKKLLTFKNGQIVAFDLETKEKQDLQRCGVRLQSE